MKVGARVELATLTMVVVEKAIAAVASAGKLGVVATVGNGS